MEIRFCGADKEVTGSCHLIEAGGSKALIDCGLWQGHYSNMNGKFPFDPKELDAVIMTHAHIDHSGRLPMLYKQGFRGAVYAAGATKELLAVMLRDAAKTMRAENDYSKKKNMRSGKEQDEALYGEQDALGVLELVKEVNYDAPNKVSDAIEFTFSDAGHLPGSASVTVKTKEGEKNAVIVFSGDIGNSGLPILKDPEYLKNADYIVMESTYGDRSHPDLSYTVSDFAKAVNSAIKSGGTVLIPASAIGRTQEILYHIGDLKKRGMFGDFPVYVDSPLAAEATRAYDKNLADYADSETLELINSGEDPLNFENLHLITDQADSIALNSDKSPKVIISTDTMAESGRIRHHLKHNIWKSNCAVILTGHQAEGTPGRALLDGDDHIKLFGENIAVKAKVYNFRGMSAHADREGLLKWLSAFEKKPEKIFLVHGELKTIEAFAEELEKLGYDVEVPGLGASFDLIKRRMSHAENAYRPQNSYNSSYYKLKQAAYRLLDAAKANGKNIETVTAQLNKLADVLEK